MQCTKTYTLIGRQLYPPTPSFCLGLSTHEGVFVKRVGSSLVELAVWFEFYFEVGVERVRSLVELAV